MKKVLSIFLSICLSVVCFVPAFAVQTSVEYTDSGQFIINNGRTDLFANFKGVMPGDKVTQDIVVKNSKKNVPVTIYLKAEVPSQYKDFLGTCDLDVYYSSTPSGEKQILQSSRASEEGELKVETLLGAYMPNESGYITVELFMYPETTNKYAQSSGKIKWTFIAEEGAEIVPIPDRTDAPDKPDKPNKPSGSDSPNNPDGPGGSYWPSEPTPDSPNTGVEVWTAFMAAGVIAVCSVVLFLINKKKKEESEEKIKEEEGTNSET